MNDEMKALTNAICPICDQRNKKDIAQEYYSMFVNRLDSMFKWSGLPETIPEYILERYLKLNGWCGIGMATHPDKGEGLYCFFGGLGSKPDEYYQPTKIILANPVLGSKEYTIGENVVWAKNDSLYRGISTWLARYSNLLAANDISINIAQVTSRIPFILSAETESEVKSAEKFIKKAEEGHIGIIRSSALNKGVTPTPTESASAGGYLKALIELHQYLKAQMSIDIGISSNFNMKRERVNTAEVETNSPYLLPLVDEMLKFRKKICDDVKQLFGQEWSVELDSAWKLEDETQKLEVSQMKVDVSSQLDSEESEEVSEDAV